MSDNLGYHVFNGSINQWLALDEASWTPAFYDAACFTDPKLAQDIGARESRGKDVAIYVLACMHWIAEND